MCHGNPEQQKVRYYHVNKWTFLLVRQLVSSAGPRDLPLMVKQPGHHVQSDQYLQLSVSVGIIAATFVALR